MKPNKLILTVILMILTLCSCRKTVRVNLVGYPLLENFKISAGTRTVLIIDNKKFNSGIITVYPSEFKYSFNKSGINKTEFSQIKIKNKEKINISCEYGDQNFKGDMIIIRNKDAINMINTVFIDDYFASVLGSEMGEYFSDETLKAQCIALKTYYYKRKSEYKNTDFNINNTDGRDMVYRGSDFATPRMYKILKEASDLLLAGKNNKLILPLFHSTSSGLILKDSVMNSKINDDIKDPVLLSDTDQKNIPLSIDSPYFYFNEVLTSEDIKKILLPEFITGDINNIELKYFAGTECVDFIGITDDNDTKWIKAYKFISKAQKNNYNNIRSISFNLIKSRGYFIFEGRGFGHLCGMSQYSAEKLSLSGYNYKEILKKYYPDAETVKKDLFIIINNPELIF